MKLISDYKLFKILQVPVNSVHLASAQAQLDEDQEKVEENKLEVTTLFSTSDGAWTVPAGGSFSQESFEQPEETKQCQAKKMNA